MCTVILISSGSLGTAPHTKLFVLLYFFQDAEAKQILDSLVEDPWEVLAEKTEQIENNFLKKNLKIPDKTATCIEHLQPYQKRYIIVIISVRSAGLGVSRVISHVIALYLYM